MGHLGREIIITDRAGGLGIDIADCNCDGFALNIVEGKRNYFYVTFDFNAIGADEAFLLVDRNNSGGEWPHPSGGDKIHVQNIDIHSNQPPDGLGELSVGFIIRLGESDSDILTLAEWQRTLISPFHFTDVVKTSLGGGFQKDSTFGPTVTTSSITTASSLKGPDGNTYTPQVGDLVADYNEINKNAEFCMLITYDILGL